jgi:hypothetical protein
MTRDNRRGKIQRASRTDETTEVGHSDENAHRLQLVHGTTPAAVKPGRRNPHACIDPRGKARAGLPNDPIVSTRSCPNPDLNMTFRTGLPVRSRQLRAVFLQGLLRIWSRYKP